MRMPGFEESVLAETVNRFETPLEIASAEVLKGNTARAREILSRFGWADNIFYSYKTNPVPEVLKVLYDSGAGAEVISERELDLAISLGVHYDRIIFNGIYKSRKALETAVDKRIGCINIDSQSELEILNELSVKKNERIQVGIRVRPSVGWQGQFGHVIGNGSAFALAERVSNNEKLDLKAVHFHLGGSLGISTYISAIDETMHFIKKLKLKLGSEIRILDIGGGFPGRDMRLLTLWEQGWLRLWDRPWPLVKKSFPDGFLILGRVAIEFDRLRRKYGLAGLQMFVEPGRLLTGDAQLLAVRVVDIKKNGRRQYAVVDGGRVGAAGPLVGEFRKVSVLGKNSGSGQYTYDIVGPTCMPWDRLFAGIQLPKLDIGDVLLIHGAGAYFVPMETEFSFDKPGFVLLHITELK